MMTSSNRNIFRVTGHLSGNSPVPGEFPHKGQWRGALMFSLICVWINDWVNNREAGDLRRYRAHYDVIVLCSTDYYNIYLFIFLLDCYTVRYSPANFHQSMEMMEFSVFKALFATLHRLTISDGCTALQWRHNGHGSVSNYQPHDRLLNRLFWRRSKKTSKLRVTGLCEGNSPGTGEFPAQRASNAENVSIWWRHHVPSAPQGDSKEITSTITDICTSPDNQQAPLRKD